MVWSGCFDTCRSSFPLHTPLLQRSTSNPRHYTNPPSLPPSLLLTSLSLDLTTIRAAAARGERLLAGDDEAVQGRAHGEDAGLATGPVGLDERRWFEGRPRYSSTTTPNNQTTPIDTAAAALSGERCSNCGEVDLAPFSYPDLALVTRCGRRTLESHTFWIQHRVEECCWPSLYVRLFGRCTFRVNQASLLFHGGYDLSVLICRRCWFCAFYLVCRGNDVAAEFRNFVLNIISNLQGGLS